jgi:hypothetical protein
MTRINAIRNIANSNSFRGVSGTINALVFAAVLIVCSIAVGCSSDQPKPISSNNQIALAQPAPPLAPVPAPSAPPAPKLVAKKAAPKKPATINYTDKTYGVTFEYPRRYPIDTGNAASEVVLTNPVAMNFVAPGGVAVAAVELPETGYDNTDFSSAFFSVSVHNSLDAGQCAEFAVPSVEKTNAAPATVNVNNGGPTVLSQSASPMPSSGTPDGGKPADSSTQVGSTEAKTDGKEVKTDSKAEAPGPTPGDQTKPADATQESKAEAKADATPASSQPASSVANASVDLKELPLNAIEAVSGEGTRQSDSRYFHVYQNGSCYEFALNVTTDANGDGLTKHIDRDRVFTRLEKILDTVKIESPATSADVKEEVKTDASAPAPSGSPAQ